MPMEVFMWGIDYLSGKLVRNLLILSAILGLPRPYTPKIIEKPKQNHMFSTPDHPKPKTQNPKPKTQNPKP